MLKVRKASFAYRGPGKDVRIPALEKISFDLKRGDFVILTGRTGAGKTTLLQLLCGLIEPDEGTIDCESRDLSSISSMIFQYPEDCFFNATVKEEIEFGIRRSGRNASRRLEEIVESIGFDLAEFGTRRPLSLSGGEQRLVAIASLIALDREIILLDEPTSGLDEKAVATVRQILNVEKSENKTVVVATHWPAEFMDLATHVMNLKDGRIDFFVTVADYVDLNLHRERLEEKERYLLNYYKLFRRFPQSEEELILFIRRDKRC